DGFETTRQLRKLDAKIPVIAVTATIASDVISKAKDAGITDILVKPFEPGDLYAKIRNHSDSPVL
ncbi:MAG: response regulator, partial [Chitinophagaceae bacterium]|nr:response regulator [Chitinophagaceae bacterium]